jgi:hypothetical protein
MGGGTTPCTPHITCRVPDVARCVVRQGRQPVAVIAPSPRWGGACAVVSQVPRTRHLSGVQQRYPSAPCTPARHALALWGWCWLLPWLPKTGGAYPSPHIAHNGPALHGMLFVQWIVFDPTNTVTRGVGPTGLCAFVLALAIASYNKEVLVMTSERHTRRRSRLVITGDNWPSSSARKEDTDPFADLPGAAPSPAWLAVVQGRRAGNTRPSIYMASLSLLVFCFFLIFL